MKIYTRKGDGGDTSLLSGGRVPKDSVRIEAYGAVDELNSMIGLLDTEPLPAGVERHLQEVQETLFAVGARLADAEGKLDGDENAWDWRILEEWIDEMEAELEPLTSFILPGGSRVAALAHLARAVCRRAERRVVAIRTGGGAVPAGILGYLNRLSDALFVLARFANHRLALEERPW